jgi:hypothetical protein
LSLQVRRPDRTEVRAEVDTDVRLGPPDGPPPSASGRRVSLSAWLVKLAADARARFYRTFGFLGVLGGVGAAAVVAGRVADNQEVWSAVAGVFFLACAALIAYAAKGLNVAAETADFVRVSALRGGSERAAPSAAAESVEEPKAIFVRKSGGSLARPLDAAEEGWLNEFVTRRTEEDGAPRPKEVEWIWRYLRRADPPRDPDERDWFRQHLEPARKHGGPPTADELAWLIREVSAADAVFSMAHGQPTAPPAWSDGELYSNSQDLREEWALDWRWDSLSFNLYMRRPLTQAEAADLSELVATWCAIESRRGRGPSESSTEPRLLAPVVVTNRRREARAEWGINMGTAPIDDLGALMAWLKTWARVREVMLAKITFGHHKGVAVSSESAGVEQS